MHRSAPGDSPSPSSTSVPPGLALLPLLQVVRELAAEPDLDQLVDLAHPERQSLELRSSADLQVWLLTWPPGAATGWHDHGGSSGAYAVVLGALEESTWELGGPGTQQVGRGEARAYVGRHLHDVRNVRTTTALTVHAYAPRLDAMTRYEREGGRLVITGVEQAGARP